ncbi:MAG: endolytic transglycosylase MltG [Clostridia bacterium]|nr:endolytic transglycosylase MltG [Clostridia bacterium]
MFEKKKNKTKKSKIIIIVVILLALMAAFLVYRPYLFDKYGIAQEDKAVTFKINDDNKNDVPYCLYQEGVITSVNLFKNYMQQENGSTYEYQSGIYNLNANMSYKELAQKLKHPDKTNLSVTIPEGKNAYQIAEILEKSGACTAKDFIAALGDNYDYNFLSSIDNADKRPYRLEGYLFPATYEIDDGTSAHDIVDMMLQATGLRLDESFRAQCEQKNLSIDDVLTMASIIEKESGGTPAEMSKVSAVFWNRLNHPEAQNTPTLGSDPTVHYADMLEEQGYPESIWKAYSTYSCTGLPTGPICSPSESAMEAALNPDSHKYYFFFSDKFEKFYYFETYEQFMQGRKEKGV